MYDDYAAGWRFGWFRNSAPGIDDWAVAPLSEPERRDLWEICEDRKITSEWRVARYLIDPAHLGSMSKTPRWRKSGGAFCDTKTAELPLAPKASQTKERESEERQRRAAVRN